MDLSGGHGILGVSLPQLWVLVCVMRISLLSHSEEAPFLNKSDVVAAGRRGEYKMAALQEFGPLG